MSDDLFIGVDPGGEGRFGVATLMHRVCETAVVGGVEEAMNWLKARCDGLDPIAAGIDTLLHWSDRGGGWRPADQRLRQAYPQVKGSVLSPNSLYGAMTIGGMSIAMRLRERWPDLLLNETHPKVLGYALRGEPHSDKDCSLPMQWLADRAGFASYALSGHEFDALLSAWATREGIINGWSDLVTDDGCLIFPIKNVTYWWPPLP